MGVLMLLVTAYVGARALVGDPPDRTDRGVDQADEGGPPGGAAARRRREPLWLARHRGHRPGADARARLAAPPSRRRGCGWPARACGRRSVSSSSSRCASAAARLRRRVQAASRSATCATAARARAGAATRPRDRARPDHAGVRRVWVAHGSGNADREVGERVGLPSADPTYTLRRVWLSDEEEAGYYYGFATRACGRSATSSQRPRFRAADWGTTPCERALREGAAAGDGVRRGAIVLVQDYHSPCCAAGE